MKKRTALVGIFIFLLFVTIYQVAPGMAATNDIKVYINDQLVTFDVPPDLKEGTTLVPFRVIFEKLGAQVGWDADNRIVTAFKDNTIIILQIGKKTASVSNKNVELLRAPEITGGRTMVPLRFVSEALGADVKWDGAKKEIRITQKVSSDSNNSEQNNSGGQLIFDPGQVKFD